MHVFFILYGLEASRFVARGFILGFRVWGLGFRV